MRAGYWAILVVALLVLGCGGGDGTDVANEEEATPTMAANAEPSGADVLDVSVSGAPGAYTFAVTVRSPDTGCDAYADWWEVLSEDGALLYRRILLHSHVEEQPFTRTGGPFSLEANAVAIVRAHMSTTGYGRQAVRLTPDGTPSPFEPPEGFAAGVEALDPQPDDCAF